MPGWHLAWGAIRLVASNTLVFNLELLPASHYMLLAKLAWRGLVAAFLFRSILPASDKIHAPEVEQTEWAALAPQLARLDPQLFFACGRNALYIFIIISSGENAISFDEVKAAVPVSAPYGTSFKSLLEAASKLGFKSEVRMYNPRDHASVPLPAIVHINDGPIKTMAHFDVMYKRDADYVYLIDGTTAQPYKTRHSRFSESDWWTGYALIRKRSIFSFIIDEYWPFLGVALLAVNVCLFKTIAPVRRPSI